MSNFKFDLGDKVTTTDNSNIYGVIVARAEYSNGHPNNYMLSVNVERYPFADIWRVENELNWQV